MSHSGEGAKEAYRVIVVTRGEFAQSARAYADEFRPTMKLVDGTELIQMLIESDLPPPISE
jgi:restriction endonuclease Mrr